MEFHSMAFFCKKDETPTFRVNIGINNTYPVCIKIGSIDIYLTSKSNLIKFKDKVILATKEAIKEIKEVKDA